MKTMRPFAKHIPLTTLAVTCCAMLSGCKTLLQAPQAQEQVSASAVQIYAREAERTLMNGLRFYEQGVFDRAEHSFRSALTQGLRHTQDIAAAYKYLAFIACAFNRPIECENNFKSAFAADPNFSLTEAEIGHPVWGPVYQRLTQK